MKIVVLTHRRRTRKPGSHLIDALSSAWTRQGHTVTAVCGLARPLPGADVAVQHIDLTVIPDEYREACRHYGLVINGAVNDISKNMFSRSIVERTDAYEGPVIIKTLANYGGLVEWRLRQLERPRRAPRTRRAIGWRNTRVLRQYRILRSVDQVPSGVWENKNLIVEKYLPEVDAEGLRSLRIWVFFGDREIHYRCLSKSRVIKSENTVSRENLPLDAVPQELKDVRRRLGFGFGKFDYALNHGRVVLYDVNKTPGLPDYLEDDSGIMEKVAFLSEGLGFFTRDIQTG